MAAGFSAGVLIGLSVAAPVGPMGLLCISRTVAQGLRSGLSTGAGATAVLVCYGGVLLFGLNAVAPWLQTHQQPLNAAAGALLLGFAWRLARTPRVRPAAGVMRHTMAMAFGTAVLFNLGNPLLFVLLTGCLAVTAPPVGTEGGLLLLGLLLGSAGWWICLTSVIALLRGHLGARAITGINRAGAAALAGLGLVALARAVLA